jgi:hypothetical protein
MSLMTFISICPTVRVRDFAVIKVMLSFTGSAEMQEEIPPKSKEASDVCRS